jgi:V-type H+-transporting ATPase subunit a
MSIGVISRTQDLDTVIIISLCPFCSSTLFVHQVLSKSTEQQHRILRTISQNLRVWNIKVLKIKAIYHTLNMLHTEGQNYVAECWIPVKEQNTVQMVLTRSAVSI